LWLESNNLRSVPESLYLLRGLNRLNTSENPLPEEIQASIKKFCIYTSIAHDL
jgi:hypothetical protein